MAWMTRQWFHVRLERVAAMGWFTPFVLVSKTQRTFQKSKKGSRNLFAQNVRNTKIQCSQRFKNYSTDSSNRLLWPLQLRTYHHSREWLLMQILFQQQINQCLRLNNYYNYNKQHPPYL
mmetsp:Transcript_51859/g.75882  ORF Transcript_51859/g.75882 Transcript_51859/m.75882 type:complete len:119 (+) Transcript_51859:69-425(+)